MQLDKTKSFQYYFCMYFNSSTKCSTVIDDITPENYFELLTLMLNFCFELTDSARLQLSKQV
jgi:hypothetical protein